MTEMFRVEEIVLVSLNFSPVAHPDNDIDGEGNNADDGVIEESKEDSLIQSEFKCGSNYYQEEDILRVILEVFITNNDYPFILEVVMGGAFKFKSMPDPKTLDLLRHVNCPAIIFPYLREVVSDITKRAGLEPFYLEPMNFVQAYKDAKNKKDIE